jgi:hypothetical protein
MFTIQKNASIVTVSTTANVLSGEQFEFLPYDAHVEVLGSIAATGMTWSMYANNELLFSGLVPNIKAGNNPVYPDDLLLSFDAAAGTRLVLSMTNASAGTIVNAYIVRGSAI